MDDDALRFVSHSSCVLSGRRGLVRFVSMLFILFLEVHCVLETDFPKDFFELAVKSITVSF